MSRVDSLFVVVVVVVVDVVVVDVVVVDVVVVDVVVVVVVVVFGSVYSQALTQKFYVFTFATCTSCWLSLRSWSSFV